MCILNKTVRKTRLIERAVTGVLVTADPALTRETTQLMRDPHTVSLGPYIVMQGPYTLFWGPH